MYVALEMKAIDYPPIMINLVDLVLDLLYCTTTWRELVNKSLAAVVVPEDL